MANSLVGSSRKLDQLNTSLLQQDSNLSRLLVGKSSVSEVGRVHLDGEKEVVGGDSLLDLVEDSEDDPGPVLERASVDVGSPVDSTREELSEEGTGKQKDVSS